MVTHDYTLPKYDKYRAHIKEARNNNCSWEYILHNETSNSLDEFLALQSDINFWDIKPEDWLKIVQLEKEAEENTLCTMNLREQAMIFDEGENNEVSIPSSNKSSWQLYKNSLLEQGFQSEAVNQIEQMSLRILKRLSKDTTNITPVKGLVIGNVQSGKTANMAALMAMAADWGWNFFIVLSGTIENLRNQTQERLYRDLNKLGNLRWYGLEHLSKKSALGQRPQDLLLEADSNVRYMTVCLKVAKRLSDLNQWLNMDKNKKRQMRILVIDDEADQAGINTLNITEKKRRAVNKQICNLVDGLDHKSKDNGAKYLAMNYIGYTATPYANLLNEAGKESLYPKNFISSLYVSNEYFGPQQIFGINGGDYDGLNIIRIIKPIDLEKVKSIHSGYIENLPKPLIDAVSWFFCGIACLRLWGYEKPASMLIHTSQKTEHHQYLADSIVQWYKSTSYLSKIDLCRKVWESETSKFTFDEFIEGYHDYGKKDTIRNYPKFEDLQEELRVLLEHQITNIPLDEENELTYHKGVHLCIDNCKNNKINEDNMYVRLAYPKKNKMPCNAPAFIVIGGATLSRGLTIEGLFSTFFLRSVGQADTLMQMGRWFGYRQGYELLPRIWITEKTNEQFMFLSSLDKELRDEIVNMDILGKTPKEYGPKVKNTPKYSFIRITAKNRMQSVKAAEYDYSGLAHQTYLFDNDKEKLENNRNQIETLIKSLGIPEKTKECNKKHVGDSKVWRNVDFQKIKQLLLGYQFQGRQQIFNNDDIKNLIDWIEIETKENKIRNWNVVLVSKNGKSVYTINGLSIGKVKRTKKISQSMEDVYEKENIINIGVLRDPIDIIADVDLDPKIVSDPFVINNVKKFRADVAKSIRDKAGLDTTPQLLIYIVDKDSKADPGLKTRTDLDACADLFGICINIPGGKRGTSYATHLQIDLKRNLFDGEGDLEE